MAVMMIVPYYVSNDHVESVTVGVFDESGTALQELTSDPKILFLPETDEVS